MPLPSFGGEQFGNNPRSQPPSYPAHYSPIGTLEPSLQSNAPGLFTSRQDIEPLSWRTSQISAQPNFPPVHYVQMLEQGLDDARKKIQHYETTIAHQATLLCQSSLIENRNTAHAFAPPTHSSVPSYHSYIQHRFSSMLGAMTEQTNGGLSSLDSDFAKRRRNSADVEAELPSKKARHGSMPPSTSFQPNSVVAIPPPPPADSDDSPNTLHATNFNDASSTPHSYEPVECNPEVDRILEVNLMRTIPERMAYWIKFSPDGQLLAVLHSKNVVTIYTVATGANIYQLKDLYYDKKDLSGSYRIYDISFNGEYLATCTGWPENVIRVWEVSKKHVRNVFKGHLGSVVALDFSPDGRLLLSGSWDASVRIWNMRDGSCRIFDNSDHQIYSVRFSPDGKHVAAGNEAGEVLLWELRSGHILASVKAHTDTVYSFDFMPNGGGFISGSWDKTLKYWDLSRWISDERGPGEAGGSGAEGSLNFVGHTGAMLSVSISPDGQWIVSGSDDHTVRIWDARTGSQQCILQAHKSAVVSVHFSSAGGYFASADGEGTVQIWSYKALS